MIKNIKDLWKQWVRATGFIHDDIDMCYKIFEAGAILKRNDIPAFIEG